MQRPTVVAEGAIAVASGVQDSPPAAQVLGAASFLIAACDVLRLDIRDVLAAVHRMAADCHYRHETTLEAVHNYVAGEIKGKFL